MIKKPYIIAVPLLSLSAKEMFTCPALNTKRMTGIPGPVDKETMYYSSHPVISIRKCSLVGHHKPFPQTSQLFLLFQ